MKRFSRSPKDNKKVDRSLRFVLMARPELIVDLVVMSKRMFLMSKMLVSTYRQQFFDTWCDMGSFLPKIHQTGGRQTHTLIFKNRTNLLEHIKYILEHIAEHRTNKNRDVRRGNPVFVAFKNRKTTMLVSVKGGKKTTALMIISIVIFTSP